MKNHQNVHNREFPSYTDSKYFTKIEILEILSILPDEKDRLLFNIAMDIGCRASEIGTIRWDNINWETRRVRLWDEKKDIWRFPVISTKTLVLLEKRGEALGKRMQKRRPFVFHRFGYKTANRKLKAWAVMAGITRRVHWHMFRKTLAVTMHKQGIPDKAIAQQLGDHIETIREYYLSVNIEDMQGYVDKAAEGRL